MPSAAEVKKWPEKIRQRYESYLRTSFFFRDPVLRASFVTALREEGSLLKGPIAEWARAFRTSIPAKALAEEFFPGSGGSLAPALLDKPLYVHQERAIRGLYAEDRNAVVATGTASGKTEGFLYPILLHLYGQHLSGELAKEGVRALVLYPMNALANDQRQRLGKLCLALRDAGSDFCPTFGQYIGQTPEHSGDRWRHAEARAEGRFPGELVFREEMRETPPHILLTNYSMLEYLLIRPRDSPLFDDGKGAQWRFLVLDEAHQYRGAKGMEMGMLIRRLKQRLREGGRKESQPFRCIATSATLSTGEGDEDRAAVARFAEALFGEPITPEGVVFAERSTEGDGVASRYHAFFRALEGAFLVHVHGEDQVRLNRRGNRDERGSARPLEIALCRECGQHYYVGKVRGGFLLEGTRDPSQAGFGVDFFLPSDEGERVLCRCCGAISSGQLPCDCDASTQVKPCESHKDRPDQLRRCEACGYDRGGVGDPVQEIVHGSDGPNAVIATALLELLPEERRKVLAFADSRQEAAFFAWYAEDSFGKLRDRNLLYRAAMRGGVGMEGLSIDDLASRLHQEWGIAGLFRGSDTRESRRRQVLTSIFREIVTDERRLSLGGVGLVYWMIALPEEVSPPRSLLEPPWNLTRAEALRLIRYCLATFLERRALSLPIGEGTPVWTDISRLPQSAYGLGRPGGRRYVAQWGGPTSGLVRHFLARVLGDADHDRERALAAAQSAAEAVWNAVRAVQNEPILVHAQADGAFRLDSNWIRLRRVQEGRIWVCDTCASLTPHFVRGVCPRYGCTGNLVPPDSSELGENHYRRLYESQHLPSSLRAEEHTAQVAPEDARRLQDDFKNGRIHLLSSSTTFEVGVSLGDLDVVFLRNVPPEPFNYVQRVGRAGRGDGVGLAVTYCRRNPHDLYHYGDPEARMIRGSVDPPRLRVSNRRIVSRHMAATALGAFFRGNPERFNTVAEFVSDWRVPRAVSDFRDYCQENKWALEETLERIVPEELHSALGLLDGRWIDRVAGEDSRLTLAEAEVCGEYLELEAAEALYAEKADYRRAGRIARRKSTVAGRRTLDFLSRKAVIPKYGFPVDVVELETWNSSSGAGVALQRDLSQAIAEYAPGGKVVANKLEWESSGVRAVTGKGWPVRKYRYDDARNFMQWNEDSPEAPGNARKYLIPRFGFVTPMFKDPKAPRGRARRVYSTRPLFKGFEDGVSKTTRSRFGVDVSSAATGTLVVLCEGRGGQGFMVCRSCGSHMTKAKGKHETPSGAECRGTLERFSLGHELVTDVIRLEFPGVRGQWTAYSVAYHCCPTNFSVEQVEFVRFSVRGVRSEVRAVPAAVFGRTG